MAVNTQKFLPSSKGVALAKVSQNIAKGSSSLGITESAQKNLGIIRVKVIEIDKILKGTLASQKNQLDTQKRQQSSQRREKQEEKLETKPKAEKGKIEMPKVPKLGIFDWIKNFIGNILLGYFAVRLVEHLPKIIPIVKFIGKATDLILGIGGKLLDGLTTFVDWGYKAYDATKGFLKNSFGEDGVKQFEQLSGLLNKFLNLALIAGMVAASSGGFGSKSGADKSGARSRPGQGGRPKVTTSGSGGLNPLRQRPKVTTSGAGGLNLLKQGPKVTVGGGGNRALLASVRPFLKRIPLPVVGALIDFGLSVALGENPGRAAFRAIGAGLLGVVGATAGSIVPVAGNFIGGLLGGFAGDAIGGALYDAFFNGKVASNAKMVKKAGGGITRGGKKQTGARRTLSKGIRKGRYRRTLAKKPGEVEISSPGADVGGEDKLFGLFPNPLKMAQKAIDIMNPFKVIENAGNSLGKSDYFGPILAITSKILLGQKPNQKDYENVGLGINLLISKGIDAGQLKGGVVAAFAEGGLVDPKALEALGEGGDISKWVADTFKQSTETNAQKTLREIQQNLKLKRDKEQEERGVESSPDSYESGPAGSSGDALTMSRNLMRDLGLTEAQAAGIVGNMVAESGVENARPQNTPPGTKGPLVVDGVTGYGIVQWTSRGRQQKLYDFAKSKGYDMSKPLSMDIEYQFFLKELRESYGHVLSQIKQANDVKTASTIFMQQYEIPAGYKTNAKIMERYNLSKPIYDKLSKGQGKATEGRGRYPNTSATFGTGKFKVIEYITGDRNHPNLDIRGHGLPSNYHDHIAFSTVAEKEKAKRALRSSGIRIGSELRPGDPGYHGRNLAIDIPGAQWGGSGAIGNREFAGSRRVRSVLGIGQNAPRFHGGPILKTGNFFGHKGEYVIDKDSVDLLGIDFVDSINRIENKSQLIAKAPSIIERVKAISGYTDYEMPSSEIVYVPTPTANNTSEDHTEDYSSRSSGGIAMFVGGESDDPFKTLYQGT
jgi:hypothetical protein